MNNRLKRTVNKDYDLPASITETLKEYSIAPIANDGDHHYGNTRIPPKTSGPYQDSKEIEIALCTDNWDVTEFSNSYLHLDVSLNVRFSGFQGMEPVNQSTPPDNLPEYDATDPTWENRVIAALNSTEEGRNYFRHYARNLLWDNQFVFFGLKCGTHVLRNYSFKFHDIPISSTNQSSALYESFLYSNFKAKNEMENKKYIFTDYKEVEEYKNTICGVYIPLRAILERAGQATSAYQVHMEIIIPYNELFALQMFEEYPNRIFGELKLVITTTSEGFVHCEVNPVTSIRQRLIAGRHRTNNNPLERVMTDRVLSAVYAYDKDSINYLRAFNQVGITSPVQFFTDWIYTEINGGRVVDLITSTSNTFSVYADSIVTNDAWADVHGYKVSDSALEALINHFSQHPFSVPAQKIETYAFPGGPTDRQLSQTMNIRLNRVTDFELLMPQDAGQRTVFRNPALNNFQLLIGFWRGPDQLISTLSPEFFTQQMQATDFDTYFVAPENFETSLSEARVCEDGPLMPTSDDTSFVPIWSVERANAGEFVFDGMDHTGIKVEINGVPFYQRGRELNIYGDGCPAPILCCTSDTFWIFRLVDGYPNCQYITQSTYEDGYKNPDQEAVKAYDR